MTERDLEFDPDLELALGVTTGLTGILEASDSVGLSEIREMEEMNEDEVPRVLTFAGGLAVSSSSRYWIALFLETFRGD